EGSLTFQPIRPDRSQSRSMFRGPSWVDHSCVPLRSSAPKCFQAASRWRKIDSSGASSRLAPLPLPKEPLHCLPAEIGSLVPAAPFLPVPAAWGGRDRRPDHQVTLHICSESQKRKIR